MKTHLLSPSWSNPLVWLVAAAVAVCCIVLFSNEYEPDPNSNVGRALADVRRIEARLNATNAND